MQRRKNHNKSKSQLLNEKRDELIITATNQVNLLVTLAILNDVFDFAKEDAELFMESYEQVLQSYDQGHEDLDVLNDNIFEVYGIKIK